VGDIHMKKTGTPGRGSLQPGIMRLMFAPRPRRWRLAFWRKPK
jgi:hypothetical protein